MGYLILDESRRHEFAPMDPSKTPVSTKHSTVEFSMLTRSFSGEYPTIDPHKVPVEEMYKTMRYSILAGITRGVYVSTMHHNSVSMLVLADRILHYTIPFAGMAAAYTSVKYIAQDLSGKDSYWNNFFGACAASAVLHAWKGCSRMTQTGFLFILGGTCAHRLSTRIGDRTFSGPILQNQPRLLFPDLSLVKEKRGWTV